MKITKEKLNKFLIVLTLLIFIFSDYLGNNIHKMFFYTDELILLAITISYIVKICKSKRKFSFRKQDKRILIVCIIIYIAGIIGNMLSGFQTNFNAIIKDALVNLKFFIPYMCITNMIENKEINPNKIGLVKIAKTIIILSVFVAILNFAFGFMGSVKYGKYGVAALTFGGHPYFSAAIIACATSILTDNVKNNKIYILLGCVLSILTFRTKAYLYIAMIIFSIIFFKKNIKIWKIVLIGIIMLAIGWNKIEYYFLDPTASRSIMLSTSVDISRKYFPFGSGFATFGSVASGEYYSRAYEIYGLSKRYGFSPQNYSFVTDGGWAGIIGQFGVFGLIGYIYIIASITKEIYQKTKFKKTVPIIGILGYLLISSTNENAFTSNYTILYAIVLAILVSTSGKEEKPNEV